ncbi:predicted protein [Postia placenta Mad-698-R]|uniref:SH3 domain-containing protein n=1 Tax=Postia placenta MAD-698-R-SB12 TaxID=670580 RepID=A0A1X6MLK4_9APHY|nr:hypothetical protein POSPLADRAFT_1067951 [Postia placenta MAD-698-R-SB12]EED78625.1 predicted protein [Postia placenta Mad-698-R]OSX57284.1 hypothetical protein POSPLADRAFT_1067951 [Postia placenta MAD-698-R-SB12]
MTGEGQGQTSKGKRSPGALLGCSQAAIAAIPRSHHTAKSPSRTCALLAGHRRRRARALEERDPSLINLPFPIPSIPILGPLLSPLIGGEPWPAATSTRAEQTTKVSPTTTQAQDTSPAADPSSSPAQDPTPEPQQTSTPAQTNPSPTPTDSGGGSESGGSSGDGQSGGEGGGSEGDGGGQGSGGSSSASGTGASGGSGESESAGDGSGGSTSGSSVSSPSDPTDPANAASASRGSQTLSVAAGSGNTPAVSQSPSGQSTNGSGDADISPFTVAGASAYRTVALAGATSVPAAIANAQGGAVISSSLPTDGSTGENGVGSAATGVSGVAALTGSDRAAAPHQTSRPSSGAGSSGSGSTAGGGTGQSAGQSGSAGTAHDPSSRHHLSQGDIAAIAVLTTFFFLLLLFLFLRKRAISHRHDRRRRWLLGGGEKSCYGRAAASGSDTASRSSSFATPAEWEGFSPTSSNAQASSIHFASTAPAAPISDGETVHVWPSNLSGSIATPLLAPTAASEPLPTVRSPDRVSWGSDGPFVDSSDASSDGSGETDWLTAPSSAALHVRSVALPSPMCVRPFTPSEAWEFPKPPSHAAASDEPDARRSRASTHATMVTPDSLLVSTVESSTYATAPENPFADPASACTGEGEGEGEDDGHTVESADAETASHFATVEVIRRPFVPTMDDEMAAAPGERVRMLRRFDDGWAYAEKVPRGRRGLIPIDCLRMPEEELPAFLAAKRLSSYRGARSPSPLWRGSEQTVGTAF